MRNPTRFLLALAAAAIALCTASGSLAAADQDVIPPQLPKEQRERLRHFLQQHEKPDRFVPAEAKLVGSRPPGLELGNENKPNKPIKQYMVQIIPHRPVPGQEEVKQVDVYY